MCDVCGAFLVKGDAHNRLSEHLVGKQHMGYAQLRATIDSLQVGSRHLVVRLHYTHKAQINLQQHSVTPKLEERTIGGT